MERPMAVAQAAGQVAGQAARYMPAMPNIIDAKQFAGYMPTMTSIKGFNLLIVISIKFRMFAMYT